MSDAASRTATQEKQPRIPTSITPACRDMLVRMLDKNPEKRITIQQCMEHPWMKGEGEMPAPTLLEAGEKQGAGAKGPAAAAAAGGPAGVPAGGAAAGEEEKPERKCMRGSVIEREQVLTTAL